MATLLLADYQQFNSVHQICGIDGYSHTGLEEAVDCPS